MKIFLAALLLVPLTANAFLGASKEECIQAYGKPLYETDSRWDYQANLSPKTTIHFEGGKAVHVRYHAEKGKEFTLENFTQLIGVSQKQIQYHFVYKMSKSTLKLHIWETDDYDSDKSYAFAMFDTEKQVFDIMIREYAENRLAPK